MVVNVKSDVKIQDKYNFYRKGGRSIIERSPVFSPDGESLAVIVENIIRVYNIQTGDCVRTLETESSINELISIQFPDNEGYNLYGCSDKGCVTTWTWENGAVLRETNLRIPEGSRILTFNLIDSNECFITAIGGTYKYLHLGTYSVTTGQLQNEYTNTRPYYFDMIRVAVGWCKGDRFAAITNGTKVLFIQNLKQPHLRSEIINHNSLRIMSVAAHHDLNAVAIADTLGRVTIIRGNLYDYRSVAREVLHWHQLPPLAICFSMQGSYLYTGGMEKVLVKYTIGNLAFKSNEKSFIPRLPGMIRYITTNNTHIAITLTNNSLVIANAQMRTVCTILECGGLSPVMRAIGSSLVYHQSLGALLMPGRTGHLQLYSTSTDKVLYNIDITAMNNIPAERWNLLPIDTEITCAAVSANGAWLVTSEYRNDGFLYPEEKLKFWATQVKGASPFKLNTCVNLSHGGCKVVSIALDRKGDICVSAGADQKFRVWKKEDFSKTSRKKISWTCLTACYYSSGISQFLSHGVLNDFKNGDMLRLSKDERPAYFTDVQKNDVIQRLFNVHKEHRLADSNSINKGMKMNDEFDMGGVALSQDGSLIAAWFGCKLTLWDTHLCNLRTTLSHPALRPKGIHVQFGSADAAHYLACTTENCLAVWSLLSLTVKWLVQINSTCLISDRFTNKMAVVTQNNDLIVFNPQNSKPILHKKRLLDPKTGVFKQCTFGSSTGDDIKLYLMRNDSEIYCIEPEISEDGRLEVISRRNLPASNFSALLAEQKLSEVQPALPGEVQALDLNALGSAAIAQFASASPHMVPPVSLLCTAFLQHISGQQEPEEEEEKQDDAAMEVDPTSSDDEDISESKHNTSFVPRITELWTPNYEAVKEKKLTKIIREPFLDLHSTSSMFGV